MIVKYLTPLPSYVPDPRPRKDLNLGFCDGTAGAATEVFTALVPGVSFVCYFTVMVLLENSIDVLSICPFYISDSVLLFPTSHLIRRMIHEKHNNDDIMLTCFHILKARVIGSRFLVVQHLESSKERLWPSETRQNGGVMLFLHGNSETRSLLETRVSHPLPNRGDSSCQGPCYLSLNITHCLLSSSPNLELSSH